MMQSTIVIAGPDTRAQHTYLVGQDAPGQWLAVETHGLGCGFFVNRDAAVGYARSQTGHRPGAVALSSAPIDWR